jgi:hypothetical protein
VKNLRHTNFVKERGLFWLTIQESKRPRFSNPFGLASGEGIMLDGIIMMGVSKEGGKRSRPKNKKPQKDS